MLQVTLPSCLIMCERSLSLVAKAEVQACDHRTAEKVQNIEECHDTHTHKQIKNARIIKTEKGKSLTVTWHLNGLSEEWTCFTWQLRWSGLNKSIDGIIIFIFWKKKKEKKSNVHLSSIPNMWGNLYAYGCALFALIMRGWAKDKKKNPQVSVNGS